MLSTEGDTLRVIRWNAPPDSISETEWRAYEADRRSAVAADPGSGALNLPREEHPRPHRKPYFGPRDLQGSAFRVDNRSHLWVRSFTRIRLREETDPSPPLRWRVFDPQGRWLGEVRIPANFEVHAIRGDLLLGVSRDSFGQEQVRAYPLRR